MRGISDVGAARAISLIFALVLLSGAAQAADVTFTNVDSYVDATFERPQSEKNKREVQEGVRRMFSELADKHLSPGQSLTVEITDIDLAGRLQPTFSGPSDIRVMSSVTRPRLKFTYTVSENGAVVASGEADVHDSNYLSAFNTRPAGERLRYEREMLAAWFRKTFRKSA